MRAGAAAAQRGAVAASPAGSPAVGGWAGASSRWPSVYRLGARLLPFPIKEWLRIQTFCAQYVAWLCIAMMRCSGFSICFAKVRRNTRSRLATTTRSAPLVLVQLLYYVTFTASLEARWRALP